MESKTDDNTLKFVAEYDESGVWFYQAFCDEIGDWAVEHGKLGGPAFKPLRMTWIKPSFAWVLYRSGYGTKHNQTRILKIQLSHATVADLLSQCQVGHGGGGTWGRVQWDPARDLTSSEGSKNRTVPRKLLRERAIQIGVKGPLSEKYVESALHVVDVTSLAQQVMAAHKSADVAKAMNELRPWLPHERVYIPTALPDTELARLGLLPGETARRHLQIGRGKAGYN